MSLDNPIISAGDVITGAQWNDPCVVWDGSQYVMYLTANQGGPGELVVPFRATSSDGTAWTIDPTPLLAVGAAGEFDHAKAETPSVVSFNGTWHMYYTGVATDLSGILAIGHATSPDGLSWTKDPGNPVLAPTGNFNDWNGAQVGEPGAVVLGGTIHLYYTAVGLRPGGAELQAMRTIGLATSTDGTSFGAQTAALPQSASYPASEGYEGYSTPAAMVKDSQVHLFYDVVQIRADETPDWVQVALHHAASADGVTDWSEDPAPFLDRASAAWHGREVRAPVVLQHEGSLRLWFAGDNWLGVPPTWGVGYGEAPETIY